MNPQVELDYIVVGQGLAGSAIAVQLLRSDRKILVIDRPAENHCSRVAAGLFNPVTSRNFVSSWMAESIFPYLHNFYRDVEKLTSSKFFYPRAIYRPFGSALEQNQCMAKNANSPFIVAISTSDRFGERLNDPFGGMLIGQAGMVDTVKYTEAVRMYITASGIFHDGHFDQDKLVIHSSGVEYGGYRAQKVIFCQGYQALNNKWFRDIIRPLKGEVIDIKTDWQTDVIMNRGVYMVPGRERGRFRVGSTYRVNDASAGITPEGRSEMESRLKALYRGDYDVVGEDWGVRPASKDRRPVLGCHPVHERLIIFNGLGTKGVSLAPYFSALLYRWLEQSEPLLKEVDVTRYY